MVLIKDDDITPRNIWKNGVIVELIEGSNWKARDATLRACTKDGNWKARGATLRACTKDGKKVWQ